MTPSARTTGGFRLYSEADVARVGLVRRMKPLDLSLEEMKDTLDAALREQLETAEGLADDLRREITRQKRLASQAK